MAGDHQHRRRGPQHPERLSQRRGVLRLNPIEFFFKVMVPAAAPYIFTGLRIGIGLSWLAIVAAEMLTGGVGIGFFIWDAWNSSRLLRHHRGAGLYRRGRLHARPPRRRHRPFVTRGTARTEGTTMSYLKIDHVDKSFERNGVSTDVLKDISLEIDRASHLDHRAFGLRQVDPAQPRSPG
jgi:hypothetical protein